MPEPNIRVHRFTIRVEVRSYNSRHLDVALKLTHGYEMLEERIKTLIADRVARGRVEIRVHIQDDSEAGNQFEANLPRARAYHETLVALNKALGITEPIRLEMVLASGGIIQAVEAGKGCGRGLATGSAVFTGGAG